jgi:uncharacterized membrane protein
MGKALKAAGITGLILAYPFLSAYLATHGFAGLVLILFASLTVWRGIRIKKTFWRLACLGFAVLLLAGAYFANTYAIWLIPSLVYAWLTLLFGHTLRHPPSLCERLVRLQFPEFKPGIAEYLREVTWVWTLFFAVNVPVCALLPWLAGPQIWSLYTGLLVYLLMGVLVTGEWLYRQRRFPELEIPPMLETARYFALHGHKAFKDIWS